MRKLVYRPEARQDLNDILRYIVRASKNPVVAKGFVDALREQCAKLASLPGTLGRPRPELGPDFRSYAHRGYVIILVYRPKTLEIVSVIEGHRDVEALFED